MRVIKDQRTCIPVVLHDPVSLYQISLHSTQLQLKCCVHDEFFPFCRSVNPPTDTVLANDALLQLHSCWIRAQSVLVSISN